MSFDKDYPNRKDHRGILRKSKAFDRTCRCHGSCSWCRDARLHSDRKRRETAEQQIREFQCE